MVPINRGGSGVVGREGQSEIFVIAGEQCIEICRAAADVLIGCVGIVDAELSGGGGHELHESLGSGTATGAGVASAFSVHDAGEQIDIEVVVRAGAGEYLGKIAGCQGRGGAWRFRVRIGR